MGDSNICQDLILDHSPDTKPSSITSCCLVGDNNTWESVSFRICNDLVLIGASYEDDDYYLHFYPFMRGADVTQKVEWIAHSSESWHFESWLLRSTFQSVLGQDTEQQIAPCHQCVSGWIWFVVLWVIRQLKQKKRHYTIAVHSLLFAHSWTIVHDWWSSISEAVRSSLN